MSQFIILCKIEQKMQTKRHRLSNQILGIQTPKKLILPILDYESVISHQQKVIRQLQHQIKYLRQYIRYFLGQNQQNAQGQQTDDTSVNSNCHLNTCHEAQSKQKIKNASTSTVDSGNLNSGIKKLVREIMLMVQAENIDNILQKLKLIIEKANKKMQPVFVERIKYKQVPVPVEIIKQIEKEVIVYKEKIVEVQVPIFRQKIVQRYIYKPPQPVVNPNLNITITTINSPKNKDTKNQEKSEDDNGQHHCQKIQQNKSKQKFKLMISPNHMNSKSEWQNKPNYSNNSTHNSSYMYDSSNNHSISSNRNADINPNNNNFNQTYSVKSPRFREKQRQKEDCRQRQEFHSPRQQDRYQQKSNFYKSPRYKQKDYN